MKKILSFTLVLVVMIVALVTPTTASGQNGSLERGVVEYDALDDYHIVKVGDSNARYVIVKRCSGPSISRGDVLIGNIVVKHLYREVYANNNNTKTNVFIEYHYSNINTAFEWLENFGKIPTDQPVDPIVYVCTGPKAKRYHSKKNCQGICNCSSAIIEMKESAAKQKGYSKCGFCYN